MKRKALGKGLDALISSSNKDSELRKVKLENIVPNEYQPRHTFNQKEIDELAQSIKENGLIQPIVVREKNEGVFEIVSGERRFRALKSLNKKRVPVIVKKIKSEKEMLLLAMIENLQRENLNPIEESRGFEKLIEDYSLVQKEVAEVVGKSRTYVTNSLRLLNLDKETKKAVEDNKISAGHGRALLSIKDLDRRKEVLKKILKKGLSVREVEKIASSSKKIKPRKKPKKEKPKEILVLENKLQEKFGTKITIKNKKKGGAINIKYYETEDLNRILDILEVNLNED